MTAYGRDAQGREYFGLRDKNDIPRCRGLQRLAGGKLDTIDSNLCINAIQARGDEVFVGSTTGLHVVSPEGILRKLPRLGNQDIAEVAHLYLDSRGVLWIAMSQGGNAAVLAAILGPDTTLFRYGESGFPGRRAGSMAEDAHGNVWIAIDDGIAIFARNRDALSIARRGPVHRRTEAVSGVLPRDILGRLRPPSPRSLQKAHPVLMPKSASDRP